MRMRVTKKAAKDRGRSYKLKLPTENLAKGRF